MLKISIQSMRIALLSLALLLTGCAGVVGPQESEGNDFENNQKQLVGDMPLPQGVRLVTDQSLILGGGNNWAGRMVLTIPQATNELFAYFRQQYPEAGWTLISSARAKNSILVLNKQDRTATIEITEGSGLVNTKSQITITITPRSTVTESPKQ
jgi:hypothetical protein